MEDFSGVEFKILQKIGQGSFGKIYVVEHPVTKQKYAMKLESFDVRVPQVLYEGQMYNILAGGPGIPHIYSISSNEKGNYIVIDLLGKSLESLLNICHRKPSLKTVLMLADQMIASIEFLHSKGFIHRDIKPDNFIIGLGRNSNRLFMIDFGLSKRYKNPTTGEHIPYREGLSLSGTARYASIPALTGVEQSRRDDLEGLAYVLIYLLKGSLPWQGINCTDKFEKHYRIAGAKISVQLTELCSGLPGEFRHFLEYARGLDFYETPEYSRYRDMFRRLFESKGYKYDYIYDWDIAKEDKYDVTVASSCSSSGGAPPKLFYKRHHFAVDSIDSRAAYTRLDDDDQQNTPDFDKKENHHKNYPENLMKAIEKYGLKVSPKKSAKDNAEKPKKQYEKENFKEEAKEESKKHRTHHKSHQKSSNSRSNPEKISSSQNSNSNSKPIKESSSSNSKSSKKKSSDYKDEGKPLVPSSDLERFYQKPKKEKGSIGSRHKPIIEHHEPPKPSRKAKYDDDFEHDAILNAVNSLQKMKEEGFLDEPPAKVPEQLKLQRNSSNRKSSQKLIDQGPREITNSADLRKAIRENIKLRRKEEIMNSTPVISLNYRDDNDNDDTRRHRHHSSRHHN